MTDRKTLEIAGVQIAVESQIPFEFAANCQPFVSMAQNPDLTLYLKPWEEIPEEKYCTVCSRTYTLVMENQEETLLINYNDREHSQINWWMSYRKDNRNKYEIRISSSWESSLRHLSPLTFFELSEFFLEYQAVILHSSVVDFNGNGIVFTAPSGTGKSTQADLWNKYYNAEVLNGDRTIIRKENEYIVYGSPYAGSSCIYKKKSAKLRAVIVLRQAQENRIRKLSAKEAYLYIASEMAVSGWNREIVERQMDWLLEMISKIPVYRLDCLPDRGAVELLRKELGE